MRGKWGNRHTSDVLRRESLPVSSTTLGDVAAAAASFLVVTFMDPGGLEIEVAIDIDFARQHTSIGVCEIKSPSSTILHIWLRFQDAPVHPTTAQHSNECRL